jgi:hypothetical protein
MGMRISGVDIEDDGADEKLGMEGRHMIEVDSVGHMRREWTGFKRRGDFH